MNSSALTTNKRRPHHKVKTGCTTCRLRRIKCDEGRPSCTRCGKAGIICEGYFDLRETWQFEPVKTSKNFTDRRQPPSKRRCGFEVESKPTQRSTVIGTTPECFSKWDVLYRDVLFGKLAESWFPNGCRGKIVPGKTILSRWAATAVTSTSSDDSRCQNDAFVFLSLCALMANTKDKRFQQNARLLYSTLLPRIRRNLALVVAIPSSHLRNDLIRSCLACAAGEYLIGSFENYERHLEGIALIIQDLDPDDPLEEESQNLILDHAAIWVGCNILRRRMPKTYPVARLRYYFKTSVVGSMREVCINAYDCLPLLERYKLEGCGYDDNQLWTMYHELNKQWSKLDGYRSEKIDGAGNVVQSCTHSDIGVNLTNGYCCGYMVHLAQHMLEVAERLKEKDKIVENQYRLRNHAKSIIAGIEELLEVDIGLSAIMCFLFPLESAWTALYMVKELPQSMVSRFRAISAGMVDRGVRPFREPWNVKFIAS